MYKQITAALAATTSNDAALAERISTDLHEVDSPSLGTKIPVSVLLPALPDGGEYAGMLVSLDGGVGDRMSLVARRELYAAMIATGVLPPVVVVSFSGGASQFYHGAWESWVVEELPDWVARTYEAPATPDQRLLTGISAGGYGALKIAFKHPGRFRAVAALEPAIMPSLTWPEQHTRASWWMLQSSVEAIWGSPFQPERFLADHPPNIAADRAQHIRDSGMEIYFEVGDEDLLNLQDGAEFLHRVLWDRDVRHEYHQVRWADHGGVSLDDRIIESHVFLAAALNGGKSAPRDLPLTAQEEAFVQYLTSGGAARGEPPPDYDPGADPERELSVMARMWAPLRDLAEKNDPAMKRAYGRLPGTD